MFMGPWDQGGPWSPTGIGGVHRFLNRVWTLVLDPHGREPGDPDAGTLPAGETRGRRQAALRSAAHRTLRDVTDDYEAFRFNTMVAKLMELSNTLFRYRGTVGRRLAGVGRGGPAAAADAGAGRAAHHRGAVEPARWPATGRQWSSIHTERWPEVDPAAVVESTREIPVQVNGKLRDRVVVAGRRVARRDRGGRPGPRAGSARSSTAGRRTGSSSPVAAGSSTSSSGDRCRRTPPRSTGTSTRPRPRSPTSPAPCA